MARQVLRSPRWRGGTRSRCVSKLGSRAKHPTMTAFYSPQACGEIEPDYLWLPSGPHLRGHKVARELMSASRQHKQVSALATGVLEILRALEKKVLWLASCNIHHA